MFAHFFPLWLFVSLWGGGSGELGVYSHIMFKNFKQIQKINTFLKDIIKYKKKKEKYLYNLRVGEEAPEVTKEKNHR